MKNLTIRWEMNLIYTKILWVNFNNKVEIDSEIKVLIITEIKKNKIPNCRQTCFKYLQLQVSFQIFILFNSFNQEQELLEELNKSNLKEMMKMFML